ncbi:MAG: hypothetical protein SFX74_03660 [Fimbriimonadaceae bacterium]|nr:hypothetical protein [Fimbriimonadaceae bacterium]
MAMAFTGHTTHLTTQFDIQKSITRNSGKSAVPTIRNLQPVAIAFTISTLSAAAILTYFAIENGKQRSSSHDRESALAAAGRAGLPTRLDTFRTIPIPGEDAALLLVEFRKRYEAANAFRESPPVKTANDPSNVSRKRSRLSVQARRSSPELDELADRILTKTQLAHNPNPEQGHEQRIPAVTAIKPFHRWLQLRVRSHIAQGEINEALDLMERHGRWLGQIFQTPSLAMASTSARQRRTFYPLLLSIISSGPLTAEQWTKVEAVLARYQTQFSVKAGFHADFALSIAQAQLIDADYSRIYTFQADDPTAKQTRMSALDTPAKRDANFAFYFRYATRVWEVLKRENITIQDKINEMVRLDRELLNDKGSEATVAIAWHIPLGTPLESEATAKRYERAVTAVAKIVKRHGFQGPFPDSLASPGPELGPDPFTGKPFQYARTNTGFRIGAASLPSENQRRPETPFVVEYPGKLRG